MIANFRCFLDVVSVYKRVDESIGNMPYNVNCICKYTAQRIMSVAVIIFDIFQGSGCLVGSK